MCYTYIWNVEKMRMHSEFSPILALYVLTSFRTSSYGDSYGDVILLVMVLTIFLQQKKRKDPFFTISIYIYYIYTHLTMNLFVIILNRQYDRSQNTVAVVHYLFWLQC